MLKVKPVLRIDRMVVEINDNHQKGDDEE